MKASSLIGAEETKWQSPVEPYRSALDSWPTTLYPKPEPKKLGREPRSRGQASYSLSSFTGGYVYREPERDY